MKSGIIHRSVTTASFVKSIYEIESSANDEKFSEADILIVDQTPKTPIGFAVDDFIKIYQIEHRGDGTYLKDITLNQNNAQG